MRWVWAIYFLSGACSLIDQVVWVRLLKLTLGNTVYAASIVVSVFLGGLALGAALMSRYADRVERRLRLYALLELLITVTALAFPLTLWLADGVYVWFYRAADPPQSLLLATQVVVSACLLLPPTVLMGSTLPLLGRFASATADKAGSRVGRLYAINTLGAAAGCYLAGFWLVGSLGVMGTLYVAAALNLVVSGTAFWLSGREIRQEAAEPSTRAARRREIRKRRAQKPTTVETEPTPLTPAALNALAVAFVASGLVSIGYEILWMRTIIFLLGGVTYVFSAVLTAYLLGNVLGAAIGSWLAKRLPSPVIGIAACTLLVGVYGVAYHDVLLSWSSGGFDTLKPTTDWLTTTLSASPFTVEPLAHCLALFVAPAALMGIGFPLALQAWSSAACDVGRSVGRAYAANTVGAVGGGLLTGFVLLPTLGAQLAMVALGVTALLTAAGLAFAAGAAGGQVPRYAIAGISVVAAVWACLAPHDRLEDLIVSSRRIPSYFELIDVKEGLTTTVSVHRDGRDRSFHLFTSGQSIAGDNSALRADQKALGHFGSLLSSDAREVLSIGFGSGETTKCLATHGFDRIDCVEIAPEVVATSLEHFPHLNLGEELHGRVNMIFMDAKNYLHLTDREYDLIVNDSIHPRDFADNASLYGKQFYEAASERLAPGGLMVTWLPTYHMPMSVFESVLGTTTEAFEHVTLWFVTPTYAPLVLVVASNDPQAYNPLHIDREMARDGVADSLATINIRDGHDVLSCFVTDRDGLLDAIGEFRVNSDGHPFIEFTTDPWADKAAYPRFVYDTRREPNPSLIDLEGLDAEDRLEWCAELRRRYEATEKLLLSYANRPPLERYRLTTDGLIDAPNHAGLRAANRGASRAIIAAARDLIAASRANEVRSLIADLRQIDKTSACGFLVVSHAAMSRGDAASAIKAAASALRHNPEDSDARTHLGVLLQRTGRADEAVSLFRRVVRDDPYEFAPRLVLAQALLADPSSDEKVAEAVEQAERAVELTARNEPQALAVLGDAYASAGRSLEADESLRRALQLARRADDDALVERIAAKLEDAERARPLR